MSDAALPPHLRSAKHSDWFWPFKNISRGWNAYGSRVPAGSKDYLPWPPRLVEGAGISRWENTGATSILYVPGLSKVKVKGWEVYGKQWESIEMNPGAPDFLKTKKVILAVPIPTKIIDTEVEPGSWRTSAEPNQYFPSALQKFADPKVSGYIKLSPEYHCEWKFSKQKELPWLLDGAMLEQPEDMLWYFWRTGARPDSLDGYYNKTIIITAGRHWE